MAECMGVGDGGGERLQWGHAPPPKKIGAKIFFGQLLCKIWAFFGPKHVKLENLVNFSGKYHKNLGILLIFRAKIM